MADNTRPPTTVTGGGRSLAKPAFPDDDGGADPQVRALLQQVAAGAVPTLSAARALRDCRLLACVVAVLDERDETGGDKDSHMAVVSMVNESGHKGLLAFSGIDALQAWNPQARPVPALGRDLARAARGDQASAVVIDVAGPSRVVLEGAALDALVDELDIDDLAPRIEAALAGLTADGWADVAVVDGRPIDAGVDVVVRVSAVGGGHPDGRRLTDLAQQAARVLASRADLQQVAPGGIGVTAG